MQIIHCRDRSTAVNLLGCRDTDCPILSCDLRFRREGQIIEGNGGNYFAVVQEVASVFRDTAATGFDYVEVRVTRATKTVATTVKYKLAVFV